MMKLLQSIHRTLGLKYRFDRCRRYVGRFGVRGAISTYRRIWLTARETSVRVPGLPHPVTVRGGTADASTLEKVFVWNEYELEYPPDVQTIVDAGANIGLSAVFFASRFPNATVLAIEPERQNFALLQRNTAPYPNIVPLHAALWSEDGTLGLSDPAESVDSYRFSPGIARQAVQAFGVLSIFRRLGVEILDVLKIDIEGGEVAVFHAAAEWVHRVRMFVVELHGPEARGEFYVATERLRAVRFQRGESEIVMVRP